MISKTRLAMVILVGALLFMPGRELFSMTKPGLNGNKGVSSPIRAVFFSLVKSTGSKGRLLGTATLDEGKLIIEVSDPRLDKLLRSEMINRGGKTKEEFLPNGKKVVIGGIQVYKPGTKEHLDTFVRNASAYGYYAEYQNRIK